MTPLPIVRVNRKAADRVQSGHPWIFSSDVIDRGAAQPGDAVRAVDHKGRALGVAHYSSTSQIALRLLSTHVEPIDENFLRKRIEAAYAYRQRVVGDSDAYRLVHAEGDLLPGLIVDRYADWLVLQLLDQGMDRLRNEIVNVLTELLKPMGIIARNDLAVRAKEELPREICLLAGDVPERARIHMNGLLWEADLMAGQKTGVFLDQRENYLAARPYARARALDCFTGAGGFALHLASVCDSVEAVESSRPAVDIARTNAKLNGLTNVEFHEANVLDYLPGLVSAKRSFDLIVIDPPAFTKSRSALEGAARGYKEINLRALRLLQTGGILVSCSCSHHMTEAHLLEVIASAALDCGKQLRVLERRTQAQDHPILLTVPETHYLKCLIFEVL
ncbi:MAG: class I SAM-dependent rRNA methyltransferase [Acidobacteriaceae bacterium]|nr:class I SAM-dependent rRNA methyltransferase [Acidobacteriaceae bacterium]MBV9296120.1 class I SAM-dependent rRNA methyltransferase [Acidobacteriaceae bacterium]MBV9767464.1 class I SAM-dependent rRNA methyltransferase [Acidobacteriaceae bacterium]